MFIRIHRVNSGNCVRCTGCVARSKVNWQPLNKPKTKGDWQQNPMRCIMYCTCQSWLSVRACVCAAVRAESICLTVHARVCVYITVYAWVKESARVYVSVFVRACILLRMCACLRACAPFCVCEPSVLSLLVWAFCETSMPRQLYL